ncbi:hypothetical protein IMG5_103280 [Ichthyophthirius multifiliis]|uniref:Uncharacterized protein n=1 Tax=Ichthyophthirius multifiliis TaxID=5932 RepID=G0QST2_ICHMU|nr:hypothetical protein IMG5_103280 [Ichthyophthirius multifiliis]EGR31727.1 hypothetical protein IMG5_103280 [Ichthyophthirius multifiliis]|eukprot:XP_004035213.1 hypothetical protein IMG5_103280 [Ichthyophthirius multifiliis]
MIVIKKLFQNHGKILFKQILLQQLIILQSLIFFLLKIQSPFIILYNNIKSDYTNVIKKSIFELGFITDQQISSGQKIYKATDTQSYIQIDFRSQPGQAQWDNQLGIKQEDSSSIQSNTLIPCKGIQGILPIEGSSIECNYVLAKYSSVLGMTQEIYPQIFIKNFVIHIPNIQNPSNGSMKTSVQVRIIQNTNNIIEIKNQSIIQINLQDDLGQLAISPNQLTYSNKKVGEIFNLSFQLGLNVQAQNLLFIQLPKYDIGFIRKDQAVSCLQNDLNLYCIPYPGTDMILILLQQPLAQTDILQINNLKWPDYQILFGNTAGQDETINIYETDQLGVTLQYVFFNNLPSPNFGSVVEGSITIPKKGFSYVDCYYVFKFISDTDIPAKSIIKIKFPDIYNLLDSDPLPEISVQRLIDYSKQEPLTIQSTIQIITITNMQKHNAYEEFYVTVTGIKNPSSNDSSVNQTWDITVIKRNELLDQDNLVLQKISFFSFDFTEPFQKGNIVFNQIVAFPMNADETATYTIEFTPNTDIPTKGQIQITFPQQNYKTLPSNPDCRLSGAVNTFSSCSLSGSTFTLRIEEKYNSGSGSIILKIANIKNPDQGPTQGFIIKTLYDGIFLDQTDESTPNSNRNIIIYSRASPITVKSVTFDPKNISEESTYTFKFITQDQLTTGMNILFQFPYDYDSLLGRNINCKILGGIIGSQYFCDIKDRGVYVKNFESYVPSQENPIIIQVNGIINPNVAFVETDWIKIATLYNNDNKFINSQPQASSVTMFAQPGWIKVFQVQPSHQKVRYKASYQYQFELFKVVPKQQSKGAIYVDFPKQFDNIEDRRVSCQTSTKEFAIIISCYVERNRVQIVGNTDDYKGVISLNINQIENPTEQGECDNFYVRSYDGQNQVIIDRSFDNLDPFYYSYILPGLIISINNNKTIKVFSGTQTEDLFVNFEVPAQLKLILVPDTVTYIKVIPQTISVDLGQKQIKFRISAPQQILVGVYYIKWYILNELIPPIYTPLKKTRVEVEDRTNIPIYINNILDIPYGGNSLDTKIYINYACDIAFQIKINFENQYKGVSLSSDVINFNKGQNFQYLRVISDINITTGTEVERGKIKFQIIGIDTKFYQLEVSSLYFTIIAADTVPPVITKLNIVDVQKNSAVINIRVNEPAGVYYMVALNNTLKAEFQEVFNKGPAIYNTTQSQYGYFVVDKENVDFKFNVEDLEAQTDYCIQVYIQDRGENVSIMKQISFKTLNRYNAANFSLRFQVRQLYESQKQEILREVSKTLSIDINFLQEQKYQFSNNQISRYLLKKENKQKRQLDEIDENLKIQTIMHLQMYSDRFKEYYPSPFDLIQSLNNKYAQLKAVLPIIDINYQIVPNEFEIYYPSFVNNPQLINSIWNQANFTVRLSHPGWVFISCVSQDIQEYPSPYQIYAGLDNHNILAPNGKQEITAAYNYFNVTVNNLKPLTQYYAYVVGGSAHPGFPDLMNANKVFRIEFSTIQSPDGNLNIYQIQIFFFLDLHLDLNFVNIFVFRLLQFILLFNL